MRIEDSAPGLSSFHQDALLREIDDPTVTLQSTEQRCKIESKGGSFVLLGEAVKRQVVFAHDEVRVERQALAWMDIFATPQLLIPAKDVIDAQVEFAGDARQGNF